MFPKSTTPVRYHGYPRIGYFVRANENVNAALYHFPGDFIAGDPFDLWLTADEAQDAQAILESLEE